MSTAEFTLKVKSTKEIQAFLEKLKEDAKALKIDMVVEAEEQKPTIFTRIQRRRVFKVRWTTAPIESLNEA